MGAALGWGRSSGRWTAAWQGTLEDPSALTSRRAERRLSRLDGRRDAHRNGKVVRPTRPPSICCASRRDASAQTTLLGSVVRLAAKLGDELQLLVGFSAPLALDNIRPRQLLLFAHLMAALALLSVSLGFAIPSVRPTIAPRAPHPIAPRAPLPIAKVAVEQFVTDLEFLGPVRASSLPMPSCALPKPGQIVGLH